MNKLTHYNVEIATEADIPGIQAIIEENLITNISQEELAQGGFIIFRSSAEELREWMQHKDFIFLVCKKDREVVGYEIACDLAFVPSELKIPSLEVQLLQNLLANHQPILYHKQIATKRGLKGVGSQLLEGLFAVAIKKNYYHLYCLIAHDPLNQASIIFHEKYHFKLIDIKLIDTIKAGIYYKKLA